jgi:hypothetical protein
MLGKNALIKKAHKKCLTSIEQRLMAGPNCQAGRGEDGAAPSLGEQWLLWKGEVKEVSACAVVSSRGGAVLECGNLFKGLAAILADSQNGNIIVLSGMMLIVASSFVMYLYSPKI